MQDFTPTPATVATEIYYTGYHPYTGEKVYTAKTEKEKLAQRSFFFWYKPENRQSIVSELRRMNRPDLIKALYPGVPEVRIRTAEERRNQPGANRGRRNRRERPETEPKPDTKNIENLRSNEQNFFRMCAMMLPVAALAGCNSTGSDKEKIIEKPDIKVVDGRLNSKFSGSLRKNFRSCSLPRWQKGYFHPYLFGYRRKPGNAEVYVMNADGSDTKRLTKTAGSESNIRWIENGEKIVFLRHDKKTDATPDFLHQCRR